MVGDSGDRERVGWDGAVGWGDGDLPQPGYWEEGVGDGDSVGWDNEMGEGDRDRAEGGLSAEAESSENLRKEENKTSVKFSFSCYPGDEGGGAHLCLLSGLWLLQPSLLLCCSLLLSSLMTLGFAADEEGG